MAKGENIPNSYAARSHPTNLTSPRPMIATQEVDVARGAGFPQDGMCKSRITKLKCIGEYPYPTTPLSLSLTSRLTKKEGCNNASPLVFNSGLKTRSRLFC
ncbi:hypothetical protein CORC01_10592 [Colletotrichum orchidophilum]|uniref:Uncharacterized protein n=1 Tax=Colletotrichum orchidophilum TaxID=1209926 RepID=A0A1G4AYF8_9PEZI|nr:uncharacterized protein CORC01_10592 [Colletotrichum orchidophilum]OHE94135.1 hypothetical protein CORC01_10592 [Colletotrichum orchidophilum]